MAETPDLEQLLVDIADLVDLGEYLDDLHGLAQPAEPVAPTTPGEPLSILEAAERFVGPLDDLRARFGFPPHVDDPTTTGVASESADSANTIAVVRALFNPSGRPSRPTYRRNSPEHLDAKAAGLVEPLPSLKPTTNDHLDDVEARTGLRLPPLLRHLYTTHGNGGFGPGYGMLGIGGGHLDDLGRDALECRVDLVGAGTLLPICNWGCATYSLVDCEDDDAAMWGFDPAADRGHELFDDNITFAAWLRAWVDRTLTQPFTVRDPTTGTWRSGVRADLGDDYEPY